LTFFLIRFNFSQQVVTENTQAEYIESVFSEMKEKKEDIIVVNEAEQKITSTNEVKQDTGPNHDIKMNSYDVFQKNDEYSKNMKYVSII